MALNDTFIKNSTKHSGKPSGDKYTDGGGMYLLVSAAGKYWRMNYRFEGKRKTLALGSTQPFHWQRPESVVTRHGNSWPKTLTPVLPSERTSKPRQT